MYGPYLMLIISACLFVFGLFWVIAPYRLYIHFDNQCEYIPPNRDYKEEFHDMNYECRELREAGREEELAMLKKNYKKSRFWYKVWSDYEILIGVLFVIICIALFVFLMWSIAAPLDAYTDIVKWEEFVVIAEETLASSTNELERAGIVNKLLEYNEWLADARASQKLFGNWSSYYNLDLPEPITLP